MAEVWPYIVSVLLLIGLLIVFAVAMHFLRKLLSKSEEKPRSSDDQNNL